MFCSVQRGICSPFSGKQSMFFDLFLNCGTVVNYNFTDYVELSVVLCVGGDDGLCGLTFFFLFHHTVAVPIMSL